MALPYLSFFRKHSRIFWLLALLLLASGSSILGTRVLIIAPNLFHGHFQFHAGLGRVLAQAGHYVHFVVTDAVPESMAANTSRREEEVELLEGVQRITRFSLPSGDREELHATVTKMHFTDPSLVFEQDFHWDRQPIEHQKKLFILSVRGLFEDNAFLETIKEERPDVGICEFIEPLALALFHSTGIPTSLTTSSFGYYTTMAHLLGIPNPLWAPVFAAPPMSGLEMNLWERVWNAYELWWANKYFIRAVEGVDEYLQKRHPPGTPLHPFPSVEELIRRGSYHFVNVAEHTDISLPISAKIKYIGGIAANAYRSKNAGEAKLFQFDEQLQNVFDRARRGVVLVSFGSVIDATGLPAAKRNAMLSAFSRFPDYQFVWRFPYNRSDPELNRLFSEHPNVYPMPWVPQRQILASPKTVGFLTHCGLNSINEAVEAGVPMVCTPIFADQFHHAVAVSHNKLAVLLTKYQLKSADQIAEALQQILDRNSEFAKNVRRLREKHRKAPWTPAEVFVKHVEFAAQFDDHFIELDLAGAKMSFWTYFGLDFILPGIALIILVVSLGSWVLIKGFQKLLFGEVVKQRKAGSSRGTYKEEREPVKNALKKEQ